MSAVSSQQRHTRAHPCPICSGFDELDRGKGERCGGFIGSDGRFAHCARPEHAGKLLPEAGGTFAHLLKGACKCGATHDAGAGPRIGGVENFAHPVKSALGEAEAVYPYCDASGNLLYEVVRFPGKQFRQRVTGPDGRWIWRLGDTPRVLYRLPDLAAANVARTVWLVEGERDVETLTKLGHLATCNPGGALKWHIVADDARRVLKGRCVKIVADRDDVGRKHARDVAASLRGVAASVVVFECARGKDITDHLANGGTLDGAIGGLVPMADQPAPSDAPRVDAPRVELDVPESDATEPDDADSGSWPPSEPGPVSTPGASSGSGEAPSSSKPTPGPGLSLSHPSGASPNDPHAAEHESAHFLSADEFFEIDESPANLVISELGIGAGPITGIVGETFTGKTIAAFACGLAVAKGSPVWERFPSKNGPWVHFDYEQGKRHTKNRIRRIARSIGIEDEELRQLIAGKRIRIAVFPTLDLTMANAQSEYARLIDGAALVTADSARVMLGAVDENSSQVRSLLARLSRASEATGAAVVLVIHAGKPSPRGSNRTQKHSARGSSGIVDEMQSMFVLSNRKGDSATRVSHQKDRELGALIPDFGLRFEDIREGDDPKHGLRVVAAPLGPRSSGSELRDLIIECVRKTPGIGGAAAVAESIRKSEGAVSTWVNTLLENGTLVERPGPNNRGRRLYLAADAPTE
jgi:5S rRNA maturation endonuclease (ribonuclease M5)